MSSGQIKWIIWELKSGHVKWAWRSLFALSFLSGLFFGSLL